MNFDIIFVLRLLKFIGTHKFYNLILDCGREHGLDDFRLLARSLDWMVLGTRRECLALPGSNYENLQ